MSRHVVDESEGRQVVVGYDLPLRQMFGQVYGKAPKGLNRHRRGPIGGWPTKTGLGIEPPITTNLQAKQAVWLLQSWLRGQGVPPAAVLAIGPTLLQEWREDFA